MMYAVRQEEDPPKPLGLWMEMEEEPVQEVFDKGPEEPSRKDSKTGEGHIWGSAGMRKGVIHEKKGNRAPQRKHRDRLHVGKELQEI